MLRRLTTRCWTLLNKPLFGTTVIPRDARVDPSRFPDDEFPVYCTKCGYQLRGLPDNRCPECGEEFDRGRLLVEQYARNRMGGRWKHSRAARAFGWLATIGLVLWIIASLGIWGILYYHRSLGPEFESLPMSRIDWFSRTMWALLTVKGTSALVTLTAFALALVTYPRTPRKLRRRVVEAIAAQQRDSAE